MKHRPQRLVCRAEYLAVQARGRRQQGSRLTLLALQDTGRPTRVGLTVSRKVGNAVVRNRVRRRLREIVRALMDGWPKGWDIVVIAQPRAQAASFAALADDLAMLVDRAQRPGRQPPRPHRAGVPG